MIDTGSLSRWTDRPGSPARPSRESRLSRRTLLAGGAALAAAGPLAAGCSDKTSESNTGQRNAAATLPTYTPVDLVKPDLPGNQNLMAGYYAYPRHPRRVFGTPPGQGLGQVSIMYPTFSPVPKGRGQNALYDRLEHDAGCRLDIAFVPSPDYAAKFATTVAGGDLPEVMVYPLPTPDQPKMMDKLYADLGPLLSGSAVQDFPYLAAFPTGSWKSAVINGTIYAVPQPRPLTGGALFGRLDLMRQAAVATEPGSYDELVAMMTALTDARQSRWAFANPARMLMHVQMMLGAPNGWSADGGSFVNSFGDERTTEATARVAEQIKKGLFHPDSASVTYTRVRELFFAGRVALTSDGVAGWDLFTRQLGGPVAGAAKLTMLIEPQAAGGGDARHFAGTGIQGITVIKKGLGNDRTRKILSLLDFLAAPIGSAEHLDRKYGVEGVDFTWVGGLPTLTEKGLGELVDTQYITDAPTIIGPGPNANVDRVYAWHKRASAELVKDPSVGLYSDTYARKGATLAQMITDAQTEVFFGRKPLSSLAEVYTSWRSAGGDKVAAEFEQSLGGR